MQVHVNAETKKLWLIRIADAYQNFEFFYTNALETSLSKVHEAEATAALNRAGEHERKMKRLKFIHRALTDCDEAILEHDDLAIIMERIWT